MSAPSSSPLLTLPRELRDEISELLLLPAHVYTSAPAPAHTLHRRMGTDATYLDTRIFLPVRAAPNMLATCRQLRDECLDLVSRRTGPRSGLIRQDLQKRKEEEDTSMYPHHSGDSSRDDEHVWLLYACSRGAFSPHFLALRPLWGRVRKLRVLVWAGFDFWKGPVLLRRMWEEYDKLSGAKPVRSKVKRTTSDQTDELVHSPIFATTTGGKEKKYAPPLPPNPLSVVIEKLLGYMPMVEELEVDVLIHTHLYWNWDLPDDEGHVQWEGLRPWLDEALLSLSSVTGSNTAPRPLRKLTKRLVACQKGIAVEKGVFVNRVETVGIW
ncbi:hypothetical protein P154DRAFT_621779 [Amniculicola lignicola CBS 123094]|uniref:Uncharacterized protein n=1 Tax=Amniculicola lignicola CBS 123094 TaxID=1392246 RepID=A0A6A5W9Q5_9PLEO|nr:hypothetical protein P154DRAFT_621779 [Amniculicola lignicola CBS 123094]